jgi:hypothetical protein
MFVVCIYAQVIQLVDLKYVKSEEGSISNKKIRGFTLKMRRNTDNPDK